MQQNSGNSYSLVYVYRKISNNQIILNTDITLRKRKSGEKARQTRSWPAVPRIIRDHCWFLRGTPYSHSAEGETAEGWHQAAIQPTTRNEYTHNSIMPSHNNTTTHTLTRTQQHTKVFLERAYVLCFGWAGLIWAWQNEWTSKNNLHAWHSSTLLLQSELVRMRYGLGKRQWWVQSCPKKCTVKSHTLQRLLYICKAPRARYSFNLAICRLLRVFLVPLGLLRLPRKLVRRFALPARSRSLTSLCAK
jgi:hypothetical protein